MIDIGYILMIAFNITASNKFGRLIINDINILFWRSTQGREQRYICIHVMSKPKIDYQFFLSSTSMKFLENGNRDGEVFNRLVDWLTNRRTILKVLCLSFQVPHILLTSFLDMYNFSTIPTCFLLSTLLRRWWILNIFFSSWSIHYGQCSDWPWYL